MKPLDPNYENIDEDISVEAYVPAATPPEPDRSPRWLRVLVGDGGVAGQQVWVRYFADNAPRGLPAYEAAAPTPGVPDAWVVSPVPVITTCPSPSHSEALNRPSEDETGWLSVEQAAPKLGLSQAALHKRLCRAARKTKNGVRVNLSGVEARKLGETWKVYIPADWRRS